MSSPNRPMPYMPPMPGTQRGMQTPGMTMPSMPQGGMTGMPPMPTMPANPTAPMPPPTLTSPYYLAGYLKNFIGKVMRVEFLVGSAGPLTDRVGTLMEVGASYIVLQVFPMNTIMICDLYSIKFATVYPQASAQMNP